MIEAKEKWFCNQKQERPISTCMFIEKTFHYIREERSLLTSNAQCVKKTENVSVDMFLSAYAISILAQSGYFCPLYFLVPMIMMMVQFPHLYDQSDKSMQFFLLVIWKKCTYWWLGMAVAYCIGKRCSKKSATVFWYTLLYSIIFDTVEKK